MYLPASYGTDLYKRYPVLYMHDGQGIFNPNPYSQQSWNIHATADRLTAEGKIDEIIVVGICNTADRSNEFTHGTGPVGTAYIDGAPDIVCKGENYEDFLINDLKPYIDSNYPTLKDRENTALMGSSMGGLVTYTIGLRHPEIFGKLGILSPYFIRLDLNTLQEVEFCNLYKKSRPSRIWLDVGDVEANILVKHVRDMADYLVSTGYMPSEELAYYCVPDAAHTEADWAKRIHSPLLYFFGSVGKAEAVQLYGRSVVGLKGMNVYMNPVVKYDSGFVMSDINGEYIADRPDILEVKPDGLILPKKEGTTNVTFASHGLKASKAYTVIKELSEFVTVSVNITVPDGTPADAKLHIGRLQIPRAADNRFGGSFSLPRDIAMQFRIYYKDDSGKAFFERGKNNGDMAYRRFKAEDDIRLDLTVANWCDQS